MTQSSLRDLISIGAAVLALLGVTVASVGIAVAGLVTTLVGLTALACGVGTLVVQRRRSRLRL